MNEPNWEKLGPWLNFCLNLQRKADGTNRHSHRKTLDKVLMCSSTLGGLDEGKLFADRAKKSRLMKSRESESG